MFTAESLTLSGFAGLEGNPVLFQAAVRLVIVSIQELILCYFYEALGLLLAEAFVENRRQTTKSWQLLCRVALSITAILKSCKWDDITFITLAALKVHAIDGGRSLA